MAKKRKNKLISPEWRQAFRLAIATTIALVIALLIFKAGLGIGIGIGMNRMMPPKLHTTELLVIEYQQLRKDI